MKTIIHFSFVCKQATWLMLAMVAFSYPAFADNTTSYDINDISSEFRAKYITGPMMGSAYTATTGSGTCISLEKSANFNDENGDGYAQVGETITYSFQVCNEGNVNLFNVTIFDQLVNVNGSLAFLAWTGSGTNCNSSTFSAEYALDEEDILACQVTNTAIVSGFGPQGQFVSDLSDDPTNSADIDLNGDGNPDDPTITFLPKPPVAGDASVVWKDQNGNGVQDNGESGIANVTVNLYTCNGGFIGSDITDASGLYSFSGLTPGNYQIQFDLSNLPPVCDFTYQNATSSNLDSDADSSGLTDCF